MTGLTPLAAGIWTDAVEPQLIGGRGPDSRIRFQMPSGDAAADFEAVALSRNGTLWSWTIQQFEPKRPPYQGPLPFVPFMLGYVELPEVIVETRLDGIAEPQIGMPLTLRIVAFDATRSIYTFGPAA